MSMTINEVDDYISITLYGPMDKYFGIGFGSNGMLNTYSIIVNGEHDSNNDPIFFEQLLDSHSAGYTLQPSFILEEHEIHSSDNTHRINLKRKLSSSVEIDTYWIFSCVDPYIDIIWSVGKSSTFERHIAFGQDRMQYKLQQIDGYDKSQIINGLYQNNTDFKLKINWMSIFMMLFLGIIAYYIVKKYKQNIIQFGQNLMQNNDPSIDSLTSSSSNNTHNNNNNNNKNNTSSTRTQYGSLSAQDSAPLIDNKL